MTALYTFQKDGRTPFLETIGAAKKSLNISAYRIDDIGNKSTQGILNAILDAKKRGVTVKVILEKETYKHDKTNTSNEDALSLLHKAGIKVFDRPHWVEQTHHKILIMDNKTALLTTGNFDNESFDGDPDYPKGTRDFTVLIEDMDMVSEMSRIFTNDTQNVRSHSKNTHFIVGPHSQREKITTLINRATKKILIYQQDISDTKICDAFLKKIKEGIEVKIIMIPFPFSKKKDNSFQNQKKLIAAGAKVAFLLDGTFVHAKIMIVDPGTPNQFAYVGSCNFYAPSLDQNREMGIILTGPKRIQKLLDNHKRDFKNSQSALTTIQAFEAKELTDNA